MFVWRKCMSYKENSINFFLFLKPALGFTPYYIIRIFIAFVVCWKVCCCCFFNFKFTAMKIDHKDIFIVVLLSVLYS